MEKAAGVLRRRPGFQAFALWLEQPDEQEDDEDQGDKAATTVGIRVPFFTVVDLEVLFLVDVFSHVRHLFFCFD
jgi:hypothetical protein